LVNSNYGTSETVDVINVAASQYASAYGMPVDIYLAVIDISLPLGGGFDVAGGWENDISGQQNAIGHRYHRVGRSVDFSRTYRDAQGGIVAVEIYIDDILQETTTSIDQDFLDQLFNELGYDRWERRINKIHYESRN